MATDTDQILAALGPLAVLYADPDVLEIMVDSPKRVLVERNGRLVEAGVTLDSPEAIRAIIDALLALNNQSVSTGETVLPISFPGRVARAMAVLPPTAYVGPMLVVRKLMTTGWISWEKLVEWGSVTQEAVDFLKQAVLNREVNILVAGGAGSGKTTVANRIAEMIPSDQRLVIVEDTHELQIRHPRAVYLEAAGQTGVSFERLIRTGAQMRPDWLIIGELSGSEAMAAVEALSRGYTGLTVLHANSLEDALMRIEAMCLMANLGLGLLEIRSLIAAAVRLVCYQKMLPNGKRKIVDLAEVRGVENGQYVIDRLFRYDPEINRLQATGVRPSWQ